MEENRQNRRRGRKRRRKTFSLQLFALKMIVLIGVLAIGITVIKHYLPNFEQVSFFNYHTSLNQDSLYMVVHNNLISEGKNPVVENGEIYLPVEFVKEYLDEYIFWDPAVNKLTITTANKVIRMNTDDLTGYINHEPMALNLPVYNLQGEAYMPENLVIDLYPVTIVYSELANFVMIDRVDEGKQMGQVVAKTANMRYEPDKKSPIARKLAGETELVLYGEVNGYTQVRTEDGLLGYVLTKDLENKEYITPLVVVEEEPRQTKPIEGKITMVWDAIYSVGENTNEDSRTSHTGLNVLCPTWFSFDEETLNGDIINIGDKSYVTWAHNNGYQVWGLLTDNFSSTVSHAVLSNSDTREHVIKQLLAYIGMYDLDGINIDFEQINQEDAIYYVQFFRELAPLMREQGAVLSVDMYVPKWTKHYNRTEVAKAVDYVCVMAYDEHTVYEGVAGPVASLGFVEEGIVETLKEVPAEKVILGMPFYTRIWKEREIDGQPKLSRRDVGMNLAKRLLDENGAELVWLSDQGSYYGSYYSVEDGEQIYNQVWLEDERSIELKLQLFESYGLAGVAGWCRGLEKEMIWDLVARYMD